MLPSHKPQELWAAELSQIISFPGLSQLPDQDLMIPRFFLTCKHLIYQVCSFWRCTMAKRPHQPPMAGFSTASYSPAPAAGAQELRLSALPVPGAVAVTTQRKHSRDKSHGKVFKCPHPLPSLQSKHTPLLDCSSPCKKSDNNSFHHSEEKVRENCKSLRTRANAGDGWKQKEGDEKLQDTFLFPKAMLLPCL